MSKSCINCGQVLGYRSEKNEIIEGSGRAYCDNCFSVIKPYIIKLQYRNDLDSVTHNYSKLIEAVENSKFTEQALMISIRDINDLYNKRVKDINEQTELDNRKQELERTRYSRRIIHAEIVGTRMSENGIGGFTANSTSYSVLVFYDNKEVELIEGNANTIQPLLQYMKPSITHDELGSVLSRLGKIIEALSSDKTISLKKKFS